MTTRDIVPGFAALVTRAREEQGLTRQQLATAAGISPTTVGDIEAERRSPSLRVAAAIATALDLMVLLRDPSKPLNSR